MRLRYLLPAVVVAAFLAMASAVYGGARVECAGLTLFCVVVR